MEFLPSNHFLALPRPDHGMAAAGTFDTSTLAAHDFDVDTRTGFMPPEPPLARLPHEWEDWEAALDDACARKLQVADKVGLTEDDEARVERWQARVRELPILPIEGLRASEVLLRRAHHVLAWIMHFYVHTIPVSAPTIHIPPPITIPLLRVSAQLQIPPVLTYSDDVLYNWALKSEPPANQLPVAPALDNLRCLTLFTGTRDEEEFYLASARIELRGVEALTLMRAVMDEIFVGDAIAARRITAHLHTLAGVIGELGRILAAVREGCDPDVFYNAIRPWFRGADSDTQKRKWVFDGIERDPALHEPTEVSGPSAGQSALIHALDVFLGVEQYSHSNFERTKSAAPTTATFSSAPAPATSAVPFLTRMQSYMPRHHRNFLRHLKSSARPLRAFVESSKDLDLLEAYNTAVSALKVFRDGHVRIVALYVLSPSKRGALQFKQLQGTGGTDALKFVQGVRDQTIEALLKSDGCTKK